MVWREGVPPQPQEQGKEEGGRGGLGPSGPALQPKRESPCGGGGSADEASGATPPSSRCVWSPLSVHKVEMGFSGGGGAN